MLIGVRLCGALERAGEFDAGADGVLVAGSALTAVPSYGDRAI